MENDRRRTDRRGSRTRRLLREALLALILEKGYSATTIEDITERADLGRTTFYLHYKDKEELLLSIINEMMDDFIAQVASQPVESWSMQSEQCEEPGGIAAPMQLVFEHAAQNGDLYRVLLHGAGQLPAATQVRSLINQAVKEFLVANRKEVFSSGTAPIPLDIFAIYFTGALLGMLTWWLDNENRYSAAEMAEFFRKLFFLGTTKLFAE